MERTHGLGRRLMIASFAAIILIAAIAGTTVRAQPPREKIEVTGTQIKRTDMETVAPVDIITREEIERSGQATAAEVLRSLPANSGGSFNETFTNSFSPGASGISLRGLGQRATLVLINGRRVSGYGFAQNLQDIYVDLNSIPTGAIERIEVLKDGASAIYGSDAIAGVVNIIFRKDYQGVEVAGKVGYFEGKHDYRFNATVGGGDLAENRWSAFGTFDFYKRELIMASDAELFTLRDRRGEPGGRNQRHNLMLGGTWQQFTTDGQRTNNFRAISECPGQVLTAAEAVDLGLIGAPLGNRNLDVPGNTFCTLDAADRVTSYPKSERTGFVGRVAYAPFAAATGYLDLSLNRVDTFQIVGSPLFSNVGVLDVSTDIVRRSFFNVNFAPGSAGNPFDTPARYNGALHDMGRRHNRIVSDTVRTVAGVEFAAGAWDIDAAMGWTRNRVDMDSPNRVSKPGVAAAFGVSTAIQPPVPLSTASAYNLDRFSMNSDAVRDLILEDADHRVATSGLRFVDARASTEAGRLWGGPIGVAIGAEVREEKLRDALTYNPERLPSNASTETDGKRQSAAIFAEAALPISRSIEAQVAARYDRYSDYGSSFTPKGGMKYSPTDWLLLRANWGRGFRAPGLVEISPSRATFFSGVFDPLTGRGLTVFGVLDGNKSLEAEKSENTTIGLVLERARGMSLGLNYYRIRWDNVISGECCQEIVDSGDPARVIRDPDTGTILAVFARWENVAETTTSGLDLDARYRIGTDFGRWTARANATYVDSYKENGIERVGTNGAVSITSIPRFRGTATLDWDYGAISATLRYSYVRGMKQRRADPSWFVEQDPRFQTGVLPERMGSYITWDMYASWRLTPALTLSASAVNLFDQMPPFDAWFFYDLTQFEQRGAQYRVGLTWKP